MFSQFRYADPRDSAWLVWRGEQPVISAPDTYARDDFSSPSAADQVLDIQSQPRRARSRVRDHRAAAYFVDCTHTHTTSPTTAVVNHLTTTALARPHTRPCQQNPAANLASHLLLQGQCPRRLIHQVFDVWPQPFHCHADHVSKQSGSVHTAKFPLDMNSAAHSTACSAGTWSPSPLLTRWRFVVSCHRCA